MGKYDEEYKKIGMNISSYRKKMKMTQEGTWYFAGTKGNIRQYKVK